MTAKLAAEGQRSAGYADLVDDTKKLNGVIFTMNADRSVGYIVQSDKPMGQRAGQMCIRNRMGPIRVYDARKPGPNPASLLAAPEADALKRCEELAAQGTFKRTSCGSLNEDIRRGERYRERVMFQGQGMKRESDGSFRTMASLITITGTVNGTLHDFPGKPEAGITSGILVSSLPDGATVINATLVNARYTEYGLSLLK